MRRPVITERNRHEWQQIAQFLDHIRKRDPRSSRFEGFEFVLSPELEAASKAGQAQRRTAAAVGVQTIPVGNHGENLNESQA